MKIKLLTDAAKMPTRADNGAAGFDVYAETVVIQVLNRDTHQADVKIGLGFASEIPEGKAALLMPRSGLGSKHNFQLRNTIGLIDSSYRGEWMIKARCDAGFAHSIDEGCKIAQFILIDVYTPELQESSELSDTSRGAGGFGSTGR